MRHRTVGKALHEARREGRGHDRELDGAAGGPGLVGQHVRRGHVAVRLDGREDAERAVPLAVERVHALVGRAGAVDDQRRPAAAARMRLEDGARSAHGELEARVGRLAHDHAAVGVQEDGGLVAGRVLELLHHQLPALGGGRPVDAAQRLALLVLPDAVQVEPGRPAHEQAPPFGRARPGLREEAVEVDEARVDEDRRAGRKVDGHALEAERVLDHDLGLLHRVAAARHAPQRVATAEAAVTADERRLALAQPGDALAQDERARRDDALLVELDRDGDVVAREPLPLAELAPKLHRPAEVAHPEGRRRDGEHEPEGDRVERLRAEGPRGEVDPASEGEDPAAAVGQHLPVLPRREPACAR
jgi:hypothetical protein